MKRKIFSKLLMGALLVASVSSFVSCKDYDDDIKDINDKLATLALQTSVDNLATQLSSAQAAAAAAQKTADQAVKDAAAAAGVANAAATQTALDAVKGTAEAAGTEAAKAIANAATAQSAAEAAQKTADQAAEAAKTAQAAAEAAAAAAASGTDAAKADAAKAAEAAAAAQSVAEAAAKAAADAAATANAAIDAVKAAQAVAEAAKEAVATEATKAAQAAVEKIDLSNYVTKDQLAEALKAAAGPTGDFATAKALNDSVSKLRSEINAIKTQVELLAAEKKATAYKASVDQLFQAVTTISLYTSEYQAGWGPIELQFESTKIGANSTFGNAVKVNNNAFTFPAANTTQSYVKDSWVKSPQPLLIRVSPVNAVLNASDIKLVDTRGNNLNNVVDILGLQTYTGRQTRADATGLYILWLQLKDGYDNAALVRATTISGKNEYWRYNAGGTIIGTNQVTYAVQINNTDSAATRYITSGFDLIFGTGNFTPATPTIDAVTDYNPTYSLGNVLIQSETSMVNPVLLSATCNRYTTHNFDKAYNSATDNSGTVNDDRSANGEGVVVATSGEPIWISFENLPDVDKFYIVRDDYNAGGDASGSSEINAWNGYIYDGLNTMYDVNGGSGLGHVTVTIPSGSIPGDVIGFRIFAVNKDGSLVDPDGAAFYAYVGKQAGASDIAGEFYATTPAAAAQTTGWLQIKTALKDADLTKSPLNSNWQVKIGSTVFTLTPQFAKKADGTGAVTKWSEAKYVNFTIDKAIQQWTDNATATGSFTTYDANNVPVDVITVSLKKLLPDVAFTKKQMNYSWKAGQLVNGVYTAYVFPESGAGNADNTWTVASPFGYKSMDQAINYTVTPNWEIAFANAKKKNGSDGKPYYTDSYVTNNILDVDNSKDNAGTALIDNATQHQTTLGYNWGKITSQKNNGAYIDYKVTVETVQTVFACPLDNKVQTLSWNKYRTGAGTTASPYVYHDVNVLTYNNTATVGGVDLGDYIALKNSFDNSIFGGTLKSQIGKYVQVKDAKLTSVDGGKEDYFTVTISATGSVSFATKSGATNPAANVPSKLSFKLVDAFGHENAYSLDFTVKRVQ